MIEKQSFIQQHGSKTDAEYNEMYNVKVQLIQVQNLVTLFLWFSAQLRSKVQIHLHGTLFFFLFCLFLFFKKKSRERIINSAAPSDLDEGRGARDREEDSERYRGCIDLSKSWRHRLNEKVGA